MKHRIVLVFLLLLAGVVVANATPQIPDILIYEGKEYPIQKAFLSDYLEKFPERDPKSLDESCTALWRGYRATFEAIKGKIYLKDVHINVCFGTPTSVLKKVVPNGEKLYADWVGGLVVSGYGESSEDPYSYEFMDSFEKYTFFRINKGNILEVRHFDNKEYRQFKKKQFGAFKKTKGYKLQVKEFLARDSTRTKADADAHIEMWIFLFTIIFLVK